VGVGAISKNFGGRRRDDHVTVARIGSKLRCERRGGREFVEDRIRSRSGAASSPSLAKEEHFCFLIVDASSGCGRAKPDKDGEKVCRGYLDGQNPRL